MKNTLLKISMSLLLVLFFSCKEENKKEAKETAVKNSVSENYNISILVDLSDRISLKKNPNPTMEIYQRDLGYIKSVSEAFTEHLKSKRMRQINDKMQLFFNPEPENPEINSISKELRISVDKDNASKKLLNSINDTYSSKTASIYESAIKDDKYIGSDIWNFFDSKVKDQCIDQDFRNILIILTDGYIFYEGTQIKEGNLSSYLTPQLIKQNILNTNDWQKKFEKENFGFIPINTDLSNLEVLVLGINPSKNNPFEEKVIKAYWTKWLLEMKIKHFEIKNADLPSNMDKIIKDFILKKE
ncbi:hypothetical protein [Flavobacterium quisquiliarum]|uniref:VWFA domain-containing protein n=1 Tax=Flavobacterium quisquiliarum TaxID=1834436 RepID=A0ABV8WAJ3_9FLAO|nr:hypothetical protein [Flavobacterium quisquiliarum]MBW1655235.1 hypothetical protein [Flavobacterium quisquiliarum]NWL00622.1 hypothetical protein [Flavobacterium collinsii]